MTDIVIYYSRTNKTRKVAEIIAQEKNAEIIEVKDKKNRKGILQFLLGGLDSLRGSKTSIEYDVVELSEYDTVYIGTPVWASKPAPAINQFISENDFKNTNVVTFATMGGSGGKSTTDAMNSKIKAKGGNIIKSFALVSNNDNLEELTQSSLNEK